MEIFELSGGGGFLSFRTGIHDGPSRLQLAECCQCAGMVYVGQLVRQR